jgi:hypothetical protein
MTQELVANMLGVRREGVTDAAGKLQKVGAIRYARGQIIVLLDRPKLEQLCSAMPWSRKKRIGSCRAELDSSRRAKPDAPPCGLLCRSREVPARDRRPAIGG